MNRVNHSIGHLCELERDFAFGLLTTLGGLGEGKNEQ